MWARGEGCPELAGLLADGPTSRVGADLRASCIEAGADLLVTRRLTSFNLIPVAVPHEFDPSGVRSVVATVAGGPHSVLAAQVAARLGGALGVPVSLVTVSPDVDSDDRAEAALRRAAAVVPAPEARVVRAANPGTAARALPAGSLLVLGLGGGTWWRRQLFGPGHRLRSAAPAGAVVVRTAPRRCFQEMGEPAAIGRQMSAAEALRLTTEAVVPVAEDGYLIGLVRRRAMKAASPMVTLESLMEPPSFVRPEDGLAAASDLVDFLEGAPVPVVDTDGRLCGLLPVSSPAPAR